MTICWDCSLNVVLAGAYLSLALSVFRYATISNFPFVPQAYQLISFLCALSFANVAHIAVMSFPELTWIYDTYVTIKLCVALNAVILAFSLNYLLANVKTVFTVKESPDGNQHVS